MRKDKTIRVHVNFDKELLDITKKRFIKGVEKNPRKPKSTSSRITLAIVRHPKFKDIKDDIIKSELKDERRFLK